VDHRNRTREDRIVVYSRNLKRPEDWVHFVHFPYFVSRWRECGFDDDDLRALEVLIMAGPDKAPVVAGTGGLRKIRFARSDGNRGKSGGARIGYAYVPQYDAIGIFGIHQGSAGQFDKRTEEDHSGGDQAVSGLVGKHARDEKGGLRR
jgi:hypothetical protein